MDTGEIENEILKQLYHWWETNSSNTVYAVFDNLENVSEKLFEKIAEDLKEKNLISEFGQSCPCNITCFGIKETEIRGLIDSEKVNRYEEIRYKVLEASFNAFESEGKYGEICVNKSFTENEFEQTELYINTNFLSRFGLIESVSTCCYRITQVGRKQFNLWKHNHLLQNEFGRISQLDSPQKRGKEFQKLVAQIAEINGWRQSESVKTSYEEVDVIIYKNREFYLIECKWEKEPIEPKEINHLLSKLNKRADTKGIVISMSGFTSGAVQNVIDSTTQKLILLFGNKDIMEIISNPNIFESALNEKYAELISKRKPVWK